LAKNSNSNGAKPKASKPALRRVSPVRSAMEGSGGAAPASGNGARPGVSGAPGSPVVTELLAESSVTILEE
jgi:hypothetical protein